MTTTTTRTIQSQVRLPSSVAIGVVMQGIRIRFGRSVVTLSGVALGIAFLMSILSSQLIKQGVADERDTRAETGRMLGFLIAEMGPAQGRTVGVLQVGELSDLERRLIRRLHGEGAESIRLVRQAGSTPASLRSLVTDSTPEAIGDGASAIVVMGASPGPPSIDWATVLGGARQRVVAQSRKDMTLSPPEDASKVALARELRPEEIERRREEAKRATFRAAWIVIIALLVTVIGISNSMLMSVTERFREIGTMKCLGALSAFIRRIFLIESSLLGLAGSIVGVIVGLVFAVIGYSLTYGAGMVLGTLSILSVLLYVVLSIAAGVVLSLLAALYPAQFASRMVPATALRTNI